MRSIEPSLRIVLLFFCAPLVAFSQERPFNPQSKIQVQRLTGAKDTLYQDILRQYEQLIEKEPGAYSVQLERCRFIQNAYGYEEYNPYYDQADSCSIRLTELFPANPEVLLYRTEFLYGDSLFSYLARLENLISNNPDTWSGFRWQVDKQLAEYYAVEGNHAKAIHYGTIAIERNDTLDLSLTLAEPYKQLNRKQEAIGLLLQHLDSTDLPWEINQKARLLLDLGEPDKAMKAFQLASRQNADSENTADLAKAMIDNGLISEARSYLAKDYASSTEWSRPDAAVALLEYDLRYGVADSARSSYQKLTDLGFSRDLFAIYRLRLLLKAPLATWSLTDLGHVLILILLLCVPFIVPYLWVLPIHYVGVYFRNKGTLRVQPLFHWKMRHFWIASSLVILSDLLATLLFNYGSFLSLFTDNSFAEEVNPVSQEVATATVAFFTFNLICTVMLLAQDDIQSFIAKIKSNASSIGVGIGLALALRVGLVVYYYLLRSLGVSMEPSPSIMADITDSIISINTFYNPLLGFLFVVIFVPFYEEVLFRGVFLSACSRHMRFIFANVLQSIVFALVHDNLKLIPFYVAFGLLAGYHARKTNSLITGTSMHMMNNLMAFLFIIGNQTRLAG